MNCYEGYNSNVRPYICKGTTRDYWSVARDTGKQSNVEFLFKSIPKGYVGLARGDTGLKEISELLELFLRRFHFVSFRVCVCVFLIRFFVSTVLVHNMRIEVYIVYK